MDRQVVVFGGFRTETLEDGHAVTSYLDALGLEQSKVSANLWEGAGDSLRSRFERSLQWLEANEAHSEELCILGYSMGCQLAARFAQAVLDRGKGRLSLGSLTLVAPDPKYRRGRQDAVERRQGVTSAYDEACVLWSVSESAGATFVEALKRVAQTCRGGCRIVFCKGDGVAEWSDNVGIMQAELEDCRAIRWIETKVNHKTCADGVDFRLDPGEVSHVECADDVHAALWYRLNFVA